MLGHIKGWLGQSVDHLEVAHRLESFCAAVVLGVAFSNPIRSFFRLLVSFFEENDFRIPREVRSKAGTQIAHGGHVQGPRQSKACDQTESPGVRGIRGRLKVRQQERIRFALFVFLKLIDLHRDRLGYLIRRDISSSTGRANAPKIGL